MDQLATMARHYGTFIFSTTVAKNKVQHEKDGPKGVSSP